MFVRDEAGRLLLLRRVDNDLWTIPTGGVKKGETVAQAGVRECREETGLHIEVTGLVGVFSTPDHVIMYLHGDRVDEVRQPINICLRARVVGGDVRPESAEAREVRWVDPGALDDFPIHPASVPCGTRPCGEHSPADAGTVAGPVRRRRPHGRVSTRTTNVNNQRLRR